MKLTVVMYHHVRRRAESRFPRVPGLEVDAFIGQIDYLAAKYRFVSARDLAEALSGGQPLPERAALLTFDDGYRDQYLNAFPVLKARGIPAVFFPSAKTLADRALLDVHKIHFIIDRADGKVLLAHLCEIYDEQFGRGAHRGLASLFPNTTRFDGGEVALVKRALQRGGTPDLRSKWIDRLYERFVGEDPARLAAELYMSADEVQHLHRSGMAIGVHGWDHPWWDQLDTAAQRRELELALSLSESLGILSSPWLFAFPYGAVTTESSGLLAERGCCAAFTTRPAMADLAIDERWSLPRLDTNDFPCTAEVSTPRDTVES